MRNRMFSVVVFAIAIALIAATRVISNDYFFSAAYTVLQFVVLATAWNILGGYCGYVNFGSAAFFAVGAYTAVAFHKLGMNVDRYFPDALAPAMSAILPLPIPVLMIFSGIIAGIIGLGMGYLTLRLRGAFFAIATLAL